MNQEQIEFMSKIYDRMFEATNMNKDEAYEFAFRVWQNKEWLKEYLN